MGLIDLARDFGPLIFGGSGFLVAVRLWFDVRAARRAEEAAKADQEAALIKISREAAGAVIADLRTEIDRLHKQLAEVEAEFAIFRKAHDTMIADKDAELALLRGRVLSLLATVEAYERLLTAHNIPHEKPVQPFFELREGQVWAHAPDVSPSP